MRKSALIAMLTLSACGSGGDSSFDDDFVPGSATLTELLEYGNLVKRGLPAKAEISFVCGPWSGMSNFEQPKDTGWIKDGAKEGRLALITLGDGSPDIVYRDATGSTITAREDGGLASFVGEPSTKEQTISVGYPTTGNAEIYAVIETTTGPKLLWSHVKREGISVRVSSYESDCIEYAQTH